MRIYFIFVPLMSLATLVDSESRYFAGLYDALTYNETYPFPLDVCCQIGALSAEWAIHSCSEDNTQLTQTIYTDIHCSDPKGIERLYTADDVKTDGLYRFNCVGEDNYLIIGTYINDGCATSPLTIQAAALEICVNQTMTHPDTTAALYHQTMCDETQLILNYYPFSSDECAADASPQYVITDECSDFVMSPVGQTYGVMRDCVKNGSSLYNVTRYGADECEYFVNFDSDFDLDSIDSAIANLVILTQQCSTVDSRDSIDDNWSEMQSLMYDIDTNCDSISAMYYSDNDCLELDTDIPQSDISDINCLSFDNDDANNTCLDAIGYENGTALLRIYSDFDDCSNLTDSGLSYIEYPIMIDECISIDSDTTNHSVKNSCDSDSSVLVVSIFNDNKCQTLDNAYELGSKSDCGNSDSFAYQLMECKGETIAESGTTVKDDSDGFPTWAIAIIIVIGCLVCIVIAAVMCCRRMSNLEDGTSDGGTANPTKKDTTADDPESQGLR